MKRSLVNLALVILLMCSVTTVAQEYEDEERDFLELSFYGGAALPSGGLSDWNDSLGAKTGMEFGVDVGYFLTSNLVLGLNFTYAKFAVDNDNEASELNHHLYNPALYLKYYFFGDGNFVPYLKGHVGVDNPKFVTLLPEPATRYRELSYDLALSFGFGAGAFYYTSDYSGLFIEAGYHMGMSKDLEEDYGGQINVFGDNIGLIELRAGISVYFSSGD